LKIYSVATQLRCGSIFITSFSQNLSLKKIVKIGQYLATGTKILRLTFLGPDCYSRYVCMRYIKKQHKSPSPDCTPGQCCLQTWLQTTSNPDLLNISLFSHKQRLNKYSVSCIRIL